MRNYANRGVCNLPHLKSWTRTIKKLNELWSNLDCWATTSANKHRSGIMNKNK